MNNDRLKFRVWDKITKRYFYLELKFGDNGYHPDFIQEPVFEQCTGLRDKSGNLIFEGDIIQAPNTPQKYIITWGHHGFISTCGCHSYPMSGTDLFEIIGNIHEQKDGE